MNAADDRAAAHAQRLRAKRALAEADAAITRLNEARTRAEALLRRVAGEGEGGDEDSSKEPEDTLRSRMRQIENRMQETDARMRLAEVDANRPEGSFGDDCPPGRRARTDEARRTRTASDETGDEGTRDSSPKDRR